jgi:conjugative transfer signal peptidase TraF
MNPGGVAVMTTVLCVSTVLALSSGPRPPMRVAYNATKSAAVGFYAVDPAGHLAIGDQVLSRLPPEIAALADERRYVPATTPVLKTVAAEAGAIVCRSGSVVSINGRTVAWARPLDRADRPLSVWSGCRRLTAGEVFLLGRHPDSFDGRYFGPTPAALILGRARPLWTW